MNADEFTDASGSDGTRFGRGFHRSNIATHEDRDVAIEEIFFANQNDVGRFYHRVGSLDSLSIANIRPQQSWGTAGNWEYICTAHSAFARSGVALIFVLDL